MDYGQFYEYKGFVGSISFSEEDAIYHGCLLNIRDFVNYEGKDLKELYQSYMNAVDDYIEIRREIDEHFECKK